ncbi:hypothetical protein BSKO_04212 [Bryopsis sp. KO-2023]|nr:hypothetical protein BSKO_04212 [Bryopsis sp. KO-2023]
MRLERTRRTSLLIGVLILSCLFELVTSQSRGYDLAVEHLPTSGVNNGVGSRDLVSVKRNAAISSGSRLLLQQNSVHITKGPEPDSSVRDDNVEISFTVTGFSVGMKCQLMLENTILRFWHQCNSPYYPKGILTRDGRYTFMVEADSGGGGKNGNAKVSWTLDRVSPQTEFVGELPPDNSTLSAVQFNFEAFDHLSGVEKVECQLDLKGWEICKSGVTFEGLSPGRHAIQIRSTDRAGNVQSPVTTHIWTLIDPKESSSQNDASKHDQENSMPDSELLASPSVENQDSKKEGLGNKIEDGMADGVDWATRHLLISIIILIVVVVVVVLCCGVCLQKLRQGRAERRRALLTLEQELAQAQDGSVSVVNPLSELIRASERSIVLQNALPNGLRRFSYAELRAATGGFPECEVLGEGGFGKVYRGVLQDGLPVAIKRLESGGQQGDREFYVEVSTLSQFNHPNIMRCLGACVENGNRCCVFDLMPKGNARDLLDHKDSFFSWPVRLKAMVGAARGLAHLHESTDPAVVHRDFKTANILLDEYGEAHISDFGLSTRVPRDLPPRSRRNLRSSSGEVLPTFGYIAPEYATSGNVTTKSDVYSLGVVMLELLTGRYPVDTSRPAQEQNLVKFVLKRLDKLDEIKKAVDPMIQGQVNEVQIAEYIEKAAACLQTSQSQRPTAAQVAVTLEQLLALQVPKDPTEGVLNRKRILVMVDSKSSAALIQAGAVEVDKQHGENPISNAIGNETDQDGGDSCSEAGPSQRRLFRGPRSDPEGNLCDNENVERTNRDDSEENLRTDDR